MRAEEKGREGSRERGKIGREGKESGKERGGGKREEVGRKGGR